MMSGLRADGQKHLIKQERYGDHSVRPVPFKRFINQPPVRVSPSRRLDCHGLYKQTSLRVIKGPDYYGT